MFGKTAGRGSMAAAITAILVLAPAISSVVRGDTLTLTTTGTGSVTIPAGYAWSDVTVQCWGGGGGGGEANYGGGGGGGAYAFNTYAALPSGIYDYYIGGGGAGTSADGLAGGNTIWNFGGAQDIFVTGGDGGSADGTGGAAGLVLAGTGYQGGAGGDGYV